MLSIQIYVFLPDALFTLFFNSNKRFQMAKVEISAHRPYSVKTISSTKIQEGLPNPRCQSGQVFNDSAVILR